MNFFFFGINMDKSYISDGHIREAEILNTYTSRELGFEPSFLEKWTPYVRNLISIDQTVVNYKKVKLPF